MYGKIFSSLYQGTLRGRAHEILVFTNMIACADRDGIVDKHPRAISEEVGLSLEQTNAAISNLEMPDRESRSAEHGGARIVQYFENRVWGWEIVNYVKYRDIRNNEERRESNKLAQRKHRQPSAEKMTVTSGHQMSSDVIAGHQMSSPSANAEGDAEADGEVKKHSSLAVAPEFPEIKKPVRKSPEAIGPEIATSDGPWRLTIGAARKRMVTYDMTEAQMIAILDRIAKHYAGLPSDKLPGAAGMSSILDKWLIKHGPGCAATETAPRGSVIAAADMDYIIALQNEIFSRASA